MKIIVGPLRDLGEEKEADVLSVRQSRRQRGASMVELGLVLFILLLLVAAIADFGRVFNSYVVINNASREGARLASRLAPNEEVNLPRYRENILDAVRREAEGSSVDLEECETNEDCDIDINPDPDDGLIASGTPITVTVRYTVPTALADIAGFGYLPLQAQTSMVVFGVGEGP